VLKAYDGRFENYNSSLLPKGSQLAQQFGVGRHFGDEALEDFRDLYFFHRDPEIVRRHFQVALPDFPKDQENDLRLFGVCFQETSGKVVKLKRYLYPADWHLTAPERI
jgi:hypothetical protein